MDFERELARSKHRLDVRLEREVRAALDRINEYTPTEWAEVEAGIREHPRTVKLRESAVGFEQIGRVYREMVDSFGAVIAALARGFNG